MAHYHPVKDIDLKWIWSVTQSVGEGQQNARTDVMLVQHLINSVMVQLGLCDSQGRPIRSYLMRDGYWGPKTALAVAAYQYVAKHVRRRYISTDGTVSPCGASGWTSSGGVQYTIVFLNRDYRDIHGKMADEKDFPAALKKDVSRVRR